MNIVFRDEGAPERNSPAPSSIAATLHRIAGEYPPALRQGQHADVPRIAFNISLLAHKHPQAVCDLGGGIGMFSVGCAALGMDVWLVDDFADAVNTAFEDSAFSVHRKYGVRVVSANVIEERLDFSPSQFDAVTSFESMEHWHSSPRTLFHQVMTWLKPGGRFVLSAPNCVNLRKRLTVPFGYGRWTPFEEWYGPDVFRGHVREPDVRDLRAIASDMGLEDVRIIGRNWLGDSSRNGIIAAGARIVDRPLRFFPSLCASIYLEGRKPLAPA